MSTKAKKYETHLIISEKDPSGVGLSKEEFLALLNDLREKGQSDLDADQIYKTLNWDSSRKIVFKDFVDALKKLISSQSPNRPRSFSLESVFGKLIHVKPLRWTDEQHQRAQKYFSGGLLYASSLLCRL